MKYPLSSILLVFTLFHATAQSLDTDSIGSPLAVYRPITIKLQDPLTRHTVYSPFRHFEILDQRPDTTRIGFRVYNALIGHGNRQMVLAGQASLELSNYLDTHIAGKTSPYTALIVIRALWLSDGTYTLAEISKDTGNLANIKTKIRLKAEVYAERAGIYTPIFRFDSTRMSKTYLYSVVGRDLAGMLNTLADSAAILLDRLGNDGKQLTLNEISHFNQSRFNPVICSGNIVLNSGVYRDFQEFKDNAPSIHNFETTRDKDRLLLYLKQNDGTSYYTRGAWGYCDGKTIYVMKDGMLVPVWKEGKAFYLFGLPEEGGVGRSDQGQSVMVPMAVMTTPVGGAGAHMTGTGFVSVGGSPYTGTNKPRQDATIKHLFTVDMDTGKLY